MDKITVVLKRPHEDPEVIQIGSDYRALKELIGGWMIGFAELPTDELIDIIHDDNFLNKGLDPSFITPENKGVICGPAVFAGFEPETGKTISLTDEQIDKVLKYLKRNVVHNMSLESAYRYSLVMHDYQPAEDAVKRANEEGGFDEAEEQ